jgi:Co/Zn/Cd efflux system component
MATSLVVYFVDPDLHPNVVKYVDPLIAILSILLIIVASVPTIRRSCDILLQTIPDHLVRPYSHETF